MRYQYSTLTPMLLPLLVLLLFILYYSCNNSTESFHACSLLVSRDTTNPRQVAAGQGRDIKEKPVFYCVQKQKAIPVQYKVAMRAHIDD